MGGIVGGTGSVGVGGKVGTGTVGVGTPVCGVGVGVPAKGVGVVIGVAGGVFGGVAAGVGLVGSAVPVGDAAVEPAAGVDVCADGGPVRVGVTAGPDPGVPKGGAVATGKLFAGVGVGLERPLPGSVGELESHAPRRTARRSPAARNGVNVRTDTG